MTRPIDPGDPFEGMELEERAGMQTLEGIAVSPGVAIAPAHPLDRRSLQVPKRMLLAAELDAEVRRFESALAASIEHLRRIRSGADSGGIQDHLLILDSHVMILEDRELKDATIQTIRGRKINAEWALKRVIERHKAAFESIQNEYLRERAADIDHIGNLVQRNLLGIPEERIQEIAEPSIVFAHDLSPADTLQLDKTKVLGFVTDMGGRTSHTAIIARALEIPAVVGAENATHEVGTGDLVIVDGSSGVVILNPDEGTLARYRAKQESYRASVRELDKAKDLKAMTRDGHAVELAANIETLEETPSLAAHGAEGVGLYRTEFLYLGRASLPTEEEHFEVYSELLRRVYPKTVTIRTLDLGGDKLHPGLGAGLESNPAMGLRAIRLCLRETDMFKAQLRALYRASVHGRMRIMLPMIAGIEEIHRAKALMEEAKASLKAEGRKFDPEVQVGMMVETPAAAILAREFAAEVDFFSIGTNDLIQYCLAIDRVNEHVAYLYEPLHPAVLRLLKTIVDAGHEGGIPVAMCGEMAGEPLHALVLLAMGFDVLSMDALSVPRVKKIVRQAAMTDAKALLEEVLKLRTATEVNAAVRRRMHQLFPEDF